MSDITYLLGKRVKLEYPFAFEVTISRVCFNADKEPVVRLSIPRPITKLDSPPFGGKSRVWVRLSSIKPSSIY